MLAYYAGGRQKFSDLEKARREANLAAVKIGNGELEALKLKGHDRTDSGSPENLQPRRCSQGGSI